MDHIRAQIPGVSRMETHPEQLVEIWETPSPHDDGVLAVQLLNRTTIIRHDFLQLGQDKIEYFLQAKRPAERLGHGMQGFRLGAGSTLDFEQACVLNGDGRLPGQAYGKIQIGLCERTDRNSITPHAQHPDDRLADQQRREQNRAGCLVFFGAGNVDHARILFGIVNDLSHPGPGYAARQSSPHLGIPVFIDTGIFSDGHCRGQAAIRLQEAQNDITGS